jgi:hypothetical protein
MGGLAAPDRARQTGPAWRWLRRGAASPDGRCVLVLLVVPVLVFVGPALFGFPALAGDNEIQNFPLRVFAGQLLSQGHLPLWNPYVWSGSPLLGGLNAGALYPFTLLFAVLPATAAWVLNLLGAYWAGGLGLYALLRQFRLAPLAALLAAITYAFGGAMVGQMVHLPIVEGMGWIPLMVLAQVRLSWAVLRTGPETADGEPAPSPGGSPWPWVALLAASIGAIFLTGEPRGMVEAELVATPLALWLAARRYRVAIALRRRASYLAYSVFGAAWAVALGAIQLVPGWAFITASQRSTETFAFLSEGSLRTSWSALLLVPDLFGGNGIGNQPVYFNSYNLPEVTGYVGLLPLVGLLVLAGRSIGRRRDRRSIEYLPWFFLALFGLLLSFGEYTPLGHLLVHIPFYSKVRLPSRSLGIVDLALAVLFGYWLDGLLSGRLAPGIEAPGIEASGRDGPRRWRERVGLLAVPVATVTLCVVAFVTPIALQSTFARLNGAINEGARLRPWFVAQALVALAVGALVLGWRRLSSVQRRSLLVAVVFCDLIVFNLSSATGFVPEHHPVTPRRTVATAVLGQTGRFAIFDTTAQRVARLTTIGQPDLNDLIGLPSVQGYGSLVGQTYGAATGAHTLDDLSGCALERGTFTQLRLHTLLAAPVFVAPPIRPEGGVAAQYDSPPPTCPGAAKPGSADRRTFYLGQELALRSVTLGRVGRASRAPLAVGVIGPAGTATFPAEHVVRGSRSWSIRFAAPARAIGLVVTGPAAHVGDDSSVEASDGLRFSLAGELQDALDEPGWRPSGQWDGYARFVRSSIRPPVWIAGPADAGTVSQLSASVVQLSTTDWGSETDSVTASAPVTVVRSEAYLTGWHAVATPPHGPARDLTVLRHGLVQSVRVPAGHWTLTFSYRPKGLDEAGAVSGLAAAGLVAVAVVGLRRRRRTKVAAAVH